ncbi:U3 small nucleolar ribonucleoprotein MPP10 [Pogona vitticeps]
MASPEASAGPSGRLDAWLAVLSSATSRPERFLSIQDGLACDFISLTKTLYDFHKAHGTDVVSGSPLKELVVEGFDEEQIWQQLELQNDAVLGDFQRAIARNVEEEGQDLCLLPEEEEEEEEEEESVAGNSQDQLDLEDETGEEADLSPDHLEEESKRKEKTRRPREMTAHSFSDDDSDMDFDIDRLEQQTQRSKRVMKKAGEKSVVDDRFFKLYEMEAVLDVVEKQESKDKGSDEEDDDEIDYFEDVLSEDEDEDDEEFGKPNMKSVKSARDLKYQDYFDPVDDLEEVPGDRKDPEDDQSEGEEEEIDHDDGSVEQMEDEMDEIKESGKEGSKAPSKRVTFTEPFDSDQEDDTDTLERKTGRLPEPKSTFEKRQEKVSEKIRKLEEELLMEKPWQLKGEVTGQKRPENSLLEEMLLFDHAVKMAPVITEETTFELEDIIKRRIKDQAWDDVVRKEKPKEDPYEYKKRLTLDHEKSKQSLAEIYEQEYLKLNQKKSEEEEKPEHVEIKKMMDSLFLKLDALSNFHFTPKPPVPEVKIVSNLPAITMEEVAPVSFSDAALLAPEEIKEKNRAGDVKTDAEKTSTDKKRERRKKKLARRIKTKEKEKRLKLLEKKSEQSPRLSKEGSAAQLKKLTKEGRTSLLKDAGKDKALKSSRAFFSQLQDQVKMQIKEKKKSPKKRELSAQKLKL